VVRTIEIVPHEMSWAARRAEEVERLRSGLGDLVIEHVGSTAVPGLAAKPVIDLLVGLHAPSDAERIVAGLGALGYRQGQSLSHEPGTFFFERAGDGESQVFHLHVAPRTSRYWHDMVSFRDALRRDPRLAHDYAVLKRQLAAIHPSDIDAYSAGKSDFVARALRGGQ
jgi:GrpB-like predicted nucleotidyltransferase (UPF0157 family)